jgi:non-ribosomal peptide synthetase component F
MRLAGTRVVLRDKRRDSDDEDLFRWLNLEEPHYYDQPDKPFTGISREEFNEGCIPSV